MKAADISTEGWRKYAWIDPVTGNPCEHKIVGPLRLYLGRSTHRVVDRAGVTHLVPSVGQMGCAVTFKATPEVSF